MQETEAGHERIRTRGTDNKPENLPRTRKQRKKRRMTRERLISMSNRGKDHSSHILGGKKKNRTVEIEVIMKMLGGTFLKLKKELRIQV